jgi:ERCC4-type nuclease
LIYLNKQEFNIWGHYLSSSEVTVDKEVQTDVVIQGVEKNRAYERKDIHDALNSIIDGRFFQQLKELSDNAEEYEPFIIFEGFGFYDPSAKKWLSLKQFFELHPERESAFYAAMAAVKAFNVGLVWTKDSHGTALFIVQENKKLGSPKVKREFPERQGFKKNWTTEQKRLYMLDCFGHETAKAIAENWVYLWNIANGEMISREQVMKDIGNVRLKSGRRIGEVKGKEIYEVLYA